MSAQFAHAPHRGSVTPQQPVNHPHAALLIDFDNVTMGIRSDLSKELKNLLSSAIIKGKVAVQRAYADWRRYPQYIVPLAESSVDLIFAPAYGSSKKNATDIRLAIDALELVFTRPEIGTFILLSGDSDFSSLVLKLKEYGKYVIGVGIRESASDLLVQNCDEYYSYSALTGLTRAGDEPRGSTAAQDPWELVEMAVTQMVENNDVMRSDRLKQVMLEMDPSFDEKALGFQKFNRFMQDAAQRGMVSLKKLENGQFEIGAALPGARAEAEEEEQRGNGRQRRSRRGGRGRGRDRAHTDATGTTDATDTTEDAGDVVAGAIGGMHDTDTGDAQRDIAASAPALVADDYEAPAASVAHVVGDGDEDTASDAAEVAPDTLDVAEIVADAAAPREQGRGRRGRGGRGRAGRDSEDLPPLETSARARGDSPQLRDAYALLRTATRDVAGRNGGTARDSDVKRRMLELQPEWDEGTLGFSKFSRFLRQAHDAEIITLQRGDTGYDVMSGDGSAAIARETTTLGRSGRGGRHGAKPAQTAMFDGGDTRTGAAESGEAPMDSQVTHPAAERAAAATPSQPAAAQAQARPASHSASSPAAQSASQAAAPTGPTMGPRRGVRGRPLGGPPPLLEGQTIAPLQATAAAAATATPATSATSATTSASEAAGAGEAAPATQAAKSSGAQPSKQAGKQTAKQAAKQSEKQPAKQPAARESKNAPFAALGFPSDPAAIASHLAEYKGVGPKSIQTLIDSFGTANVFDALQNRQDRVRELLGARAETLLDAWGDEYTLRKANATPPEKQKASASPEKRAAAKKGPRGSGPAKGGRGGAARGGARTGGRSSGSRKPTRRA